jgi:hypothetical protein
MQKAATDLGLLDVEQFGTGLHVRIAQDGPDPEKLRSELAARGIPVTGVIDADVTLEDVFLSVVGKAEKKAPTAAKASKPS